TLLRAEKRRRSSHPRKIHEASHGHRWDLLQGQGPEGARRLVQGAPRHRCPTLGRRSVRLEYSGQSQRCRHDGVESFPRRHEALRAERRTVHDQLPRRRPAGIARRVAVGRREGGRQGRRIRVREVRVGDRSRGEQDRAVAAARGPVMPTIPPMYDQLRHGTVRNRALTWFADHSYRRAAMRGAGFVLGITVVQYLVRELDDLMPGAAPEPAISMRWFLMEGAVAVLLGA